jgi:hypothetical protein
MGQSYIGSESFWARLCSVSDPQDSIKELRAIHFTQLSATHGGYEEPRVSKKHRLDRHRLLKEPVQQLAPVPRRPAIKTEGNLPRRRHTTHWAWLTQVDSP